MTAPNRETRRLQSRERRRLKTAAAGAPLSIVPESEWPREVSPPPGMVRLWRSARLLVFECDCEAPGVRLLMVQRIDGRDGLTWDELYEVKAQLGYGDHEAVEIYPPECHLVNVANMRHLWVLPHSKLMPFGFRRKS